MTRLFKATQLKPIRPKVYIGTKKDLTRKLNVNIGKIMNAIRDNTTVNGFKLEEITLDEGE